MWGNRRGFVVGFGGEVGRGMVFFWGLYEGLSSLRDFYIWRKFF